MVVSVLHEAGVDLHLPGEDRLEVVRHVVPSRDLLGTSRELGVGRDHAELLLTGEGPFAKGIPAVVELALVLG